MKTLLTSLLLIVFISCSETTTNPQHLISDSTLRANINTHFDRFDTVFSKEGIYLKALVLDDSIFLKSELRRLMRYYQRSDTMMTDTLRNYSKSLRIRERFPSHINAYRLEISDSRHYQDLTSITVIENTQSNLYKLTLENYTWYENKEGKIDLQSVNTNQTIPIRKDQWDHFTNLLYEAYFWRITEGDREEQGIIHPSTWIMEGINHSYSVTRYHRVHSELPRGKFKEACDYLVELAEENQNNK